MPWALRRQHGFTLIELLVVILVIGVLASVAIPAFLSQRARANDTKTREQVRVARMAIDTFATSSNAGYSATPAELIQIEPTLGEALNLKVAGDADSWRVSADSPPGNGGTFSMSRNAAGEVRRDCTNRGQGGCRATPDPSGDFW